ncbi:1-phosphatidylinositol 4-kinase [Spizellomyces sp. 'palustris']|nr:1-phosphatidylinositol 4-kinase [Spizellomyces sp. 'palustris']
MVGILLFPSQKIGFGVDPSFVAPSAIFNLSLARGYGHHLLISRSTESVALENFLLKRCRISTHAALLTLWYLQSHLSDMRGSPNTESFRLCQRLYHKCQAIVFADAPLTPKSDTSFKDIFQTKKVRENVRPAVIGIGAILAAGVCPLVVETGASMIISQGRRWKTLASDPGEVVEESSHGSRTSLATRRSESVKDSREYERGLAAAMGRRHSTDSGSSKNRGLKLLARIPTGSATPDELSRGGAFSFNRYVAKASGNFTHSMSLSTSASAECLNRHSSTSRANEPSLESLDILSDQRHLKTSHYFHSELQFMMTLVEISDRLRTVPKEARQSTLVAELALLNHNLPANVCIPMWCKTSGSHAFHHRVARISPSDAVVLNSADRVPFLLTVEVLENNPQGSCASTTNLGTTGSQDQDNMTATNGCHSNDEEHAAASLIAGSLELPNDEADRESQQITSSDSDSVDPQLDSSSVDYHSIVIHRRKSVASLSSKASASPYEQETFTQLDLEEKGDNIKPIPSAAEEFSERMRTAAVMLAQLYQQQQRELMSQSLPLSSPPSLPQSPVVIGAGGLPGHVGWLSAVPQGNTGTHPGSVSPSVTPKDRRNYQKLKADFEQIRNRLIKEMVTLEEKRVEALAAQLKERQSVPMMVEGATDEILPEEEEESLRAQCQERDKDDPSAAVFRETWDEKVERIRASSPYGKDPNWRLLSVIVKSGADLRQEQLALQLIKEMQRIWREAGVPVWVCYFRILITSEQSGIVETIRDAISVHSIKKNGYAQHLNEKGLAFTLYDYFVKEFGQPGSTRFLQAQDNFMRSLAAYSVICYLLQIKDRHNGNILIDIQGHIIHIDFGFMLSNSPGSLGFELAPFKLPQDYVDILGGVGSDKFNEFRALMKEAFFALRKKADDIVSLVEMMEHGSSLPCFTGASAKPSNVPIPPTATSSSFLSFLGSEGDLSPDAARATLSPPIDAKTTSFTPTPKYPVGAALSDRFHLSLSETEFGNLVDSLVERSCNSAYTRLYDSFQYYANGIL